MWRTFFMEYYRIHIDNSLRQQHQSCVQDSQSRKFYHQIQLCVCLVRNWFQPIYITYFSVEGSWFSLPVPLMLQEVISLSRLKRALCSLVRSQFGAFLFMVSFSLLNLLFTRSLGKFGSEGLKDFCNRKSMKSTWYCLNSTC